MKWARLSWIIHKLSMIWVCLAQIICPWFPWLFLTYQCKWGCLFHGSDYIKGYSEPWSWHQLLSPWTPDIYSCHYPCPRIRAWTSGYGNSLSAWWGEDRRGPWGAWWVWSWLVYPTEGLSMVINYHRLMQCGSLLYMHVEDKNAFVNYVWVNAAAPVWQAAWEDHAGHPEVEHSLARSPAWMLDLKLSLTLLGHLATGHKYPTLHYNFMCAWVYSS